MSSDSSLIDAALILRLNSDTALLALCPNGVYMDEAPVGSTKFVIVSLVEEVDDATFVQGRTIEDALYLVEARMLASAGGDIKAAAARIDVLLEDQPLTLGSPPAAVPGYTWMTVHRENRLRTTEVDQVDPNVRWYRRGGHYRVQMALT